MGSVFAAWVILGNKKSGYLELCCFDLKHSFFSVSFFSWLSHQSAPLITEKMWGVPDHTTSPEGKGVTVNRYLSSSLDFAFLQEMLLQASLFCFPFWIHNELSTYMSCYLYDNIFTHNFLVSQFRSGQGSNHKIIWCRWELKFFWCYIYCMLDKIVVCCK